jgi:CRP-like cAMP-binding protein
VLGATLATLAVLLHRPLSAIDAEITVPRQRLETLLRDPILGPLPTTELEQVASGATEIVAAPGELVVRIGDVGEHYYAIVDGVVEVANATTRRRLGTGEGFGEIALLRDVTRTATVTAVEPTILTVVGRPTFLAAVRGHQRSAAVAEALAHERLARDREGTP